MKKRLGLYFAVFLVVIIAGLLLAHKNINNSADDDIRETIIKYNAILPQAMEQSTYLIRPVATDSEQGRMEIFRTELADQNKIIKMKLDNLKFIDKIRMIPAQKADTDHQNTGSNYQKRNSPQMIDLDKLVHATVQTDEMWEYQYLDLKTHQSIGSWEQISYQTTYTLVKIEGNWFVQELKFKEKVS